MEMAGVRMPIESLCLQALVSEPIKPVIDCVVMANTVHGYLSQSDKGELVVGGGTDPYNNYSQRGSFPALEHTVTALVETFPIISRLRMLRMWGGIVDMTGDRSPIIGKTDVDGLYVNCGWGTGGFKAIPGSGFVFADTIANDRPHPIAEPFGLQPLRRRPPDRRKRRRGGGALMGASILPPPEAGRVAARVRGRRLTSPPPVASARHRRAGAERRPSCCRHLPRLRPKATRPISTTAARRMCADPAQCQRITEPQRDYLFIRHNPKGLHFERWRCDRGCGKWFHAARDTVTMEFKAFYGIAELPPPELMAEAKVRGRSISQARRGAESRS